MRSSRLLAAVAAGACLAAVSPALTSAAAPLAGSGGAERVLLILTPQNRAGLQALGATKGLSLSQRRGLLANVLPSSQQVGDVRAIAGSLGFKVTAQSPLSVTLTAPASVVSWYFGSARSVDPTGRFAHALPRMPQAFSGMVTAAFGGDETRPAARPLANTEPAGGYTGAQLANAYAPTAFAAANTLANQTVATIQLADWSDGAAAAGTTPRDLTNFAAANGTPLAAGQYTSVLVDSSQFVPDPGVTNTVPGGSQEVALDQETLLSVAPFARQRAYFAGNDPVGLLEDYLRVGYDASNGVPITALSTSWGDCEEDFGPTAFAFDDVFSYILSTGVTIFAASGDSGPNDCPAGDPNNPGNAATVDFPASSPEVVAVGGTKLPSSASPPSAGTPQPASQTPWAFNGTDGSGGGQSTMFGRPAWQLSRYSSISGSGRLVPDIASDADPATGFESVSSTYNTAPASGYPPCTSSTCTPVWEQVGGTSLASPTQAALYTDELISRGIQNGLGDIHARLYAAPASDFVASSAQAEVTGLGAPNWDALFPAIATDPGAVSAVVNPAGHVYSHRGNGAFVSLGGTVISPVSTVDYHGINYYVATGTTNQIYVRTDGLGWRPFTNYSFPCLDPEATVALSGTFFVACMNPTTHAGYVGYAPLVDGHLPLLLKGSSGTFRSIGGSLQSGPAIFEIDGNPSDYVNVVTNGGTPGLVVFAVGPHYGDVYEDTVGFNSSAQPVGGRWTLTSFRCLAAPALAVRGSSFYFSCIGTNHALYFDWHKPSGWQPVLDFGGYELGSNGLAAAPNGQVTSFMLNRDGTLYSKMLFPTFGPWNSLGSSGLRFGVGATEQSG